MSILNSIEVRFPQQNDAPERWGAWSPTRLWAFVFPRGANIIGALLGASLLATAVLAADQPITEAPRRGGTLRLGMSSDIPGIDPPMTATLNTGVLSRMIFRGLVDYDEQNRPIPDQCSGWELSDDKRTYTFRLKPGIRFGHGREVEAEDYVFALERILHPKTGAIMVHHFDGILGAKEFMVGNARQVAGLRAPDRRTLVIELAKPSYVFLLKLGLPCAHVVPRELVQQQGNEEFNRHLVGSGPYRLKDHRPGMRWRFERNPHYTGADGFVDEVEVTVGGDVSLIAMLVEREEMDLGLDYLLTADVVRLQRDTRQRRRLHLLPYAGVDYLFINTEMKPFHQKLVRQAVAHALNRERLARLSHPYTRARGIIPHNAPWENPELRDYDYNPEKARDLLREAGFPNGFSTDLWHRPDRGAQLAQGVQEDLRNVGITANLHVATEAVFYEKCGIRGQVPLGLADWVWDFPDVIGDIDPPFNGARLKDAGCSNTSFYANPEVDHLIGEVDKIFDPAARVRMLRRIEALVVDDVPSVTLNNWRLPTLFSARLRGLKMHPVWRFRLETFWLAP